MAQPEFTPTALTPEQQREINQRALAESELQVINARTAYLRTLAAHNALVASLKDEK
jgi:hypothetical protein